MQQCLKIVFQIQTKKEKEDQIKDINIQIENINTYFEAPVSKNIVVGKMMLSLGKQEVLDINILTNEEIESLKAI